VACLARRQARSTHDVAIGSDDDEVPSSIALLHDQKASGSVRAPLSHDGFLDEQGADWHFAGGIPVLGRRRVGPNDAVEALGMTLREKTVPHLRHRRAKVVPDR
jgi:hypothetical protein